MKKIWKITYLYKDSSVEDYIDRPLNKDELDLFVFKKHGINNGPVTLCECKEIIVTETSMAKKEDAFVNEWSYGS